MVRTLKVSEREVAFVQRVGHCQWIIGSVVSQLPTGWAGHWLHVRHVAMQMTPPLPHRMHIICMRMLLHFRIGTHTLTIVLGRRSGVPQDRHLCLHCSLHAVHDGRYLLLECPAMHLVRDRYPALFSPAKSSMQLFMWQPDVVGVAHFVMDSFDLLGVAPDAHDEYSDSDSFSSALAAV